MVARIPELIRKQVEKAYINGEGSRAELARRFGISEPSVKRITKGMHPLKKSVRQEIDTAIGEAIKERARRVEIAGVEIDPGAIIRAQIVELNSKMPEAPVRSYEGCIRALLDLLAAYRTYNPLSLEELADFVLATPGFEPREFARILREKLERPA